MANTPQPPSIYAGSDAWGVYRGQQQEEEQKNSLSTLLIAEEERKRKESQQAALDKLIQFGVENPGREHLNTSASSEAPTQAPSQSTAPTGTGSNAPTSTIKPTAGRDIYGVNAAEGANRVNANTGKFGVSATQDANGNVTLSNVGTPQGTWYAQPGTASMPNVSNDLFAAINQLKATNDGDAARGILANIRESAAQKNSSLMMEAMDFASKKLGVPFLEAQLREAEAADRADPQWYPGIGDSPITAKIRTALLTTRASVDNEAKNYLATNTTYASMNAAIKTAEEEAKRIDRISQRKENITDTMAMRKLDKEDLRVQEATAIRDSLSPEELKRVMVLQPSLANETDPTRLALGLAATIKRADKDKGTQEALSTPDMDLPALALTKNADALAITFAKEKELNPLATDVSINAKLMEVEQLAGNKKSFIDMAVRRKFGNSINSEAAKEYKASLNSDDLGLSAAERLIKKKERNAAAMDLYRWQATDRFLADTSSWGIQDPDFLTAQDRTFKITGRRDLDSVLSAYIENANPETLLPRLKLIQSYAIQAAGKSSKSLFGTPDQVAIQARIAKAVQAQGLWTRLNSWMGKREQAGVDMVLGAVGAFMPPPQAPMVDPITGLLN